MSTKRALWCLVLAGCVAGGDDGGDEEVGFTEQQVTMAGEALAAGLEEIAQRFRPGAMGEGDASCMTESGDSTDADGDLIPADAVVTFDCMKRRLGYTGTLTGTVAIVDDDPNAPVWGFNAGLDLQASLTGPFGGSMVVDSVGSVVALHNGPLAPYRLTSALDVSTVITKVSGEQVVIDEHLGATLAYTPGLDWSAGEDLVIGTIFVDGGWTVSVGGKTAEATLSTPARLTVAPSCETVITGGRVEASFAVGSSSAIIAVEWSACGKSTVSYHEGA